MTCTNCQHPESAHEPTLFGTHCIARVLTDQPEWLNPGTPCGCRGFVPVAEQGNTDE